MSTDIHQLRRQNSEGTVIGGKGLVQLGHLAANAWQPLHQMHLETHFGKVQRGLNAGNASTNYEYIPYSRVDSPSIYFSDLAKKAV